MLKTKSGLILIMFTTIVISALSTVNAQTIWHVDDSSTGGLRNGSDWENAFVELQSALAVATYGDEIRVAQGSYKPDYDVTSGTHTGDREMSFELESGLSLYGGYAGIGGANPDTRDIENYETVLSGDLTGNDEPNFVNNDENSIHVVYIYQVDSNGVLDGFTISNGNANRSSTYGFGNYGGGIHIYNSTISLQDCRLINNSAEYGGGIHNRSFSSPTFVRCEFVGNQADFDGGMDNEYDSNPILNDCVFTDNTAKYVAGGIGNSYNSNATLTNCTFSGNSVSEPSGDGGGMFNYESRATLTNCTFDNNSVQDNGGAIFNNVNSQTTLTNCIFTENYAKNVGGAVSNENESDSSLRYCTFTGNTTDGHGGGLSNENNCDAQIYNCTFDKNTAQYSGGGVCNTKFSNATVSSCVFINNESNAGAGVGNSLNSNPSLTNCTFSRNTGQAGAAIYNATNSNPTIINCIISENSASMAGGGILNSTSSPIVMNCRFKNNSSEQLGGAVYNASNSDSTMMNCNFIGNISTMSGGAIVNLFSRPTIGNCAFIGNGVQIAGAGVFNYESNPFITNCTFSSNSAARMGGGIFNGQNSIPAVTNCVLWNNVDSNGINEASQIYNYETNGTPNITYSCIQGLDTFSGNGNTGNAPLFADLDGLDDIQGTEDDDLRLLADSPCINRGDNSAVPAELTTDLDGLPRVQTCAVDMGAYEYQDYLPYTIFGDADRDCDITLDDYSEFKSCLEQDYYKKGAKFDDCTHMFDSDGDSDVDLADFAAFQRAFAESPVIQRPDWYVDDSSINGSNDGSDWDNAFTQLQAALNVAKSGDVIWVAQGTYLPDFDVNSNGHTGNRQASFELKSGVKIYGGYAGYGAYDPDLRNVVDFISILSGDLAGNDDLEFTNYDENSYHVLIAEGIAASSTLDGFTISGGNATGTDSSLQYGGGLNTSGYGGPTIINCTFKENQADYGGGVSNNRTTPNFNNCTFQKNKSVARFGGGMYNYRSNPTLTNSSFKNNYSISHGGGIYFENSYPILTGCTFNQNTSQGDGGGVHNFLGDLQFTNCTFIENDGEWGGGLCNQSCSSTLTRCEFSGNSASRGGGISNDGVTSVVSECSFKSNSAHYGGGVYNYAECTTAFNNCLFTGNASDSTGGGISSHYTCEINVTSSLFIRNIAGDEGGGLYNSSRCTMNVANCTFTSNTSTETGGGIADMSNNLSKIANCILWGNTGNGGSTEGAQIQHDYPEKITITHSCIQGLSAYIGNNNIGDDPLFVTGIGLDGIPGTGDDDFRLQENSPCVNSGDNSAASLDSTDLNGLPRIQNCTVDMGAYEYQGDKVFGDVDGNCIIDLNDYADFETCLEQSGIKNGSRFDVCLFVFDSDGDADVDLVDFAAFQRVFNRS